MLTSSLRVGSASLQLSKAILVYSGASEAIATIHQVASVNNKPTIQAGRLFTYTDLETLHGGLSDSAHKHGAAWVEPTLLAYGGGKTIWYSEPGKRAMFFKTNGSAGEKLEASALLPVPGLVWMRERESLYVYAFRGAKRPDYDTKLCQAPFFNVYDSGRVCEGTSIKPPDDAPNIAWENAFFQSRFTHANVHARNRLIQGMEPLAFWTEMLRAPKQTFPPKRLVDLDITVGDLTKMKVKQ
jgi:PRTRC genetic system protein B